MAETGQDRPENAKDESEPSLERDACLEKIKRQLAPPAGSVPMQGYLLKRSETLRRWNQRWFTLDPTTAKMEYRMQRGDPFPRGLLVFEASSTITVSPINFHGAKQYEGCCFYIGGSGTGPAPRKREYFLCAETPGAARAWVATLRAAAVVLKAHREAVDSIGATNGGGKAKAGAVAAAAAVANATAREAAKEVAAANQMTVLGTHHIAAAPADEAPFDNVTIMKETLRVKDEELHEMAADLRAREATLNELAHRLSETAQAAESAAEAAHSMDRERKAAKEEGGRLRTELEARLEEAGNHVKAAQEREAQAVAIRDEALAEVERLKMELLKAAERISELQVAANQAEARGRLVEEREREAEAAREQAQREADRWRAEAMRLGSSGSAVVRDAGGISGVEGEKTEAVVLPEVVPTPASPAIPGHTASSNGTAPGNQPMASTTSSPPPTTPEIIITPNLVNAGQPEVGEVNNPPRPSKSAQAPPGFSAPAVILPQITPANVAVDLGRPSAPSAHLLFPVSGVGTSTSPSLLPHPHEDTPLLAESDIEILTGGGAQSPAQPPSETPPADPFPAVDPLFMDPSPAIVFISGPVDQP